MTADPGAVRTDRARRLAELHRAPEILVLVNVWDVASAVTVARQPGCTAIATASAAIAAAHGYPDGEQVPLELVIAAHERIVGAVDLPVTADLEAGYGDVGATIRQAVQVGVVGANIEDGMRPFADSVAAVEVAVRAAADEGVDLVLNARTDAYLKGRLGPGEAFGEAAARGRAFLDSGASCVFVPGCTARDAIARLAEQFDGRLSLLGLPGLHGPAELQRLGVARVSYGPFAHRHTMKALGSFAEAAIGGRNPLRHG